MSRPSVHIQGSFYREFVNASHFSLHNHHFKAAALQCREKEDVQRKMRGGIHLEALYLNIYYNEN